MLVGVLGAGVIALFAAISIAEARASGPREAAPRGPDGPRGPGGGGRRPAYREQTGPPQYAPTGPPASPQQPHRPTVGVPALAQQHGRRPAGRPVRPPGERFDDAGMETVALPTQAGLAVAVPATPAPSGPVNTLAPQAAAREQTDPARQAPVTVVPAPADTDPANPKVTAVPEQPAFEQSASEQTVFLRIAAEPATVGQTAPDQTAPEVAAPAVPVTVTVDSTPSDVEVESPVVPQAAPEVAGAPIGTDSGAAATGEAAPARPAPRRRPSPTGLRPPAAMAPAPPAEPTSEAG